MTQQEIKERIWEFIEHEGRSCSMDIAGITPEYVYRMWGGKVPLKDILEVFQAQATFGRAAAMAEMEG